MLRLDDRDLQILKVLSREGRLPKAELAKRINLSPTPCWERLKRLEAAGVIESYHAQIALRHIAQHVTVFVAAELGSHRVEDFQSFERAVARRAEIVACWSLGGGFDYLMQVVTRDIDSYQRLMDELLAERVGLVRYYTYIVTRTVKAGGPPPLDQLMAETD